MSNNFSYSGIIFSLILVLVLTIWFVFSLKSSPKPPKRSVIKLPQKIYPQKATNTNNNVVGAFALNIITIGGHNRLREASLNYQNNYELYAEYFNQAVDIQKNINDSLNAVGEMTYKILFELEKSQKLLKRSAQRIKSLDNNLKFNNTSSEIYKLRRIADEKSHTGVILIQGTALGGLAAVGSWTLVSMLGSASTGTAIASLSGVAAHNAILAWFGGGALAVGGGGMAAGTITLGAIIALPVVILSAYKTHSSANDLTIKTEELKIEIPKMGKKTIDLLRVKVAIDKQLKLLEMQHRKIHEVNKQVYKVIYPNGIFSKAKRNIDSLLKQDFYTKFEAENIDKLLYAVHEANELFNSNPTD